MKKYGLKIPALVIVIALWLCVLIAMPLLGQRGRYDFSDPTSATGNYIPDANNSYDLGSATNRWKDIWVSGDSVHIGSVNLADEEGCLGTGDFHAHGKEGVGGYYKMSHGTTPSAHKEADHSILWSNDDKLYFEKEDGTDIEVSLAEGAITLECMFIEDQANVSLINNQIVPWATSPSILTGGTFTSNRYTVGQDGRFEVHSILSILNQSGQANDTFQFQIRKNGIAIAMQEVNPMSYAGDTEETQISITGVFDFSTNDVIDLYVTNVNDVQNYTSRQLSIKQLPVSLDVIESNLDDIYVKSTGLIEGGVPSVNGGNNTLIDITAGSGQIADSTTDPDNPVLTPVAWTAKTGYNLTTTASAGDVVAIFLSLDSSGNVVERLALPTAEQRRDTIDLGIAARNDSDVIVFAGSGPLSVVHNPTSQLQDLMQAWGPFNVEGNKIEPYASDLQITKTLGSVFRNGANFSINPKDPHVVSLVAQDPISSFNYKLSDGTDVDPVASELDPDKYDDGTSTPGTVPNNKWTAQQVSVFASGVVEVLYGQEVFATEEDAITALANIEFTIPSDSKGAVPLAYVVLQQSDTAVTSDRIYRINRGGSGGGSVSYWNRADSNLSPATVGDNVNVATQTELSSYPNFSADPSWTIFSGTNTWTYDSANDRMKPTGENTGDTITDTGIALTSGKTYVVSLSWFKFIGTGSLQIYQGSGGTQISDYIDDGTFSRKWMFTASASENLFVRTTANFHDDTTTNYISGLSVIEIDNAGDIVGDRLALGGAKPEYYSQLDNYADIAAFFPSNKGIFTVDEFIIRNINLGGLDFDETYARPMLSSYATSIVLGSNGYADADIRADDNINLRTYTAGGVITLNESSLDTDFVLNGSGVEAYKYDAGDAIHNFTNGKVMVSDYTKLGAGAPSIKVKKLTSNTAPTTGDSLIAHGISSSAKILSITGLINAADDVWYPLDSSLDGYKIAMSCDDTNVILTSDAIASANVLYKPVKVLVTYEE